MYDVQTPSRPRIQFKVPQFLRLPLMGSFLIGLVLTLLSLVYYFQLQPVIPFFYSLAIPSQQLAPKEWLFFFPIFSLLVTFIHVMIATVFREYSTVMLKLFGWVTLGLQVVWALSMIRIILIVS